MSRLQTEFTRRLGIDHPIIQAPMASAGTVELAVAVSEAGGLGSLGAAMLSPAALLEAVAELRAATDRPFNVNLMVLEEQHPTAEQLGRAIDLLAPARAELGLAGPFEPPKRFGETFPEQLDALIEAAVPVASFTFGILGRDQVDRLHRAGSLVVGTATTAAEARAWEAVGADAVCAQGAEAGGHRGTFLGPVESALIGTMALVPQVVDAVSIPVIAAGGIVDGRGVAAALCLGAAAVQIGTAFLFCPEAGVHPVWRQRLRESTDQSTGLTRAFTGRHARGIVNRFMRDLSSHQDEVPTYPVQAALTASLRAAAARAGNPEYMSLWSGQAAALARELAAADLVATLAAEAERALERP